MIVAPWGLPWGAFSVGACGTHSYEDMPACKYAFMYGNWHLENCLYVWRLRFRKLPLCVKSEDRKVPLCVKLEKKKVPLCEKHIICRSIWKYFPWTWRFSVGNMGWGDFLRLFWKALALGVIRTQESEGRFSTIIIVIYCWEVFFRKSSWQHRPLGVVCIWDHKEWSERREEKCRRYN